MKELFNILNKKPNLYEQTQSNMWDDPHISKGMLKAHLDITLDSATRNLEFVNQSVNWITNKFPTKQYPKLLDLGCGPGIYTELFCKKGYQVTGVDISKRSIKYAINSAKQKQLNITYLLQDYTLQPYFTQANLITLIYCDFGVLSTQTRGNLLNKIYQTLLPDGVFIFDVFTNKKYENIIENNEWKIEENGFWHKDLSLILHSFIRYDSEHTYLNRYNVLTQNEILSYHVWEHTFTIQELTKDLNKAGFKDISFYRNLIGDICGNNDETICIIAKK